MSLRVLALTALTACAPESSTPDALLPVHAAAVPPGFQASDVGLDAHVTFDLVNAVPGERVSIARGGVGAGPCLPALGGACLGVSNPVVMTRITIEVDGTGTATLRVPNLPALNGGRACFQAVAVRGVNGVDTELSTVRCVDIGYDADDDRILDADDVCPGFDDFFDWDLDAIPDGCDVGAGRPPEFTNALPIGAITRRNFQSRAVVQHVPNNPVGIVFCFHGTGGDADFVEATEMTRLLNELVSRGFGYVSVSSEARTPAVWDDASAPASNPDWQRLIDLRANLVSRGDITNNTPVFVHGFSGGGPMASYMANAAQAANWPIAGGALMGTNGRSDRYGDPPSLPFVFVTTLNDTVVPPSTVFSRYQGHVSGGGYGVYVEVPEERLAPTRFAMSTYFDPDDSMELFKMLVNRGYYTKRGFRTFATPDIDATVDEIGAIPGFYPSLPGQSILSVVHALHALTAGATEEIADTFEGAL
jgi:hypothetical protein